MIEEFVQEYKRRMNEVIRRKLMEAENKPSPIEQWYRRAIALNRNWRESRQEEERLRSKKEQERGAPRQEQRQILLQPLVWQRRQMPSKQETTRPALIEEVKQTNAVMVRGLEQGMRVPPRRDPYAIEVDRGRNCYACRGFGHLAYHCRNQRGEVAEERKMEYNGRRKRFFEYKNNLKGEENLDTLD